MRIATLGLLAVLASATTVTAADLDYGYLRGADDGYAPAPVIDWSGFYVGGHGGYSSAGLGFKSAFRPIVENALRYSTVEPPRSNDPNDTADANKLRASDLLSSRSVHENGPSYGAFVGYNVQFDDIVFGFEADYTYFGKKGSSHDKIARFWQTSDNYLNTVALEGVASTELQEYGTIRGRLGYAVGSFLPFVTGGLAVGRATVTDTVAIQHYGYDRATYLSNIGSTNPPAFVNHYGYAYFDQANPGTGVPYRADIYGGSKKVTIGGVALGAGLEFAVTSNILLRGEYQYVLFNDFKGHSAEVNTVRGGASVKF
ncbi:porin [Methylobacterium sp. Leaf456]|uniref:outer membrane protein n=1 Tax=Methylobacterium sp. Leaf456 TaxID=1736382 RepID=UPI0006FB0233|nr:outer membrane beta-barrel protein [Methylobacterium sp. Leaf456]KQT50145.1 porin [Methylobacterium sp. Leaf456]